MPVLVDTGIWSLALRRHRGRLSEAESGRIVSLHELVPDGLARLIGPIRQKLLSECRSRGVSGSGVDFLICAVTITRGWQIFTTDSDFRAYAKVVPIQIRVPL